MNVKFFVYGDFDNRRDVMWASDRTLAFIFGVLFGVVGTVVVFAIATMPGGI